MTDPHVPLYKGGEPSSSLLVRVKAQDRTAWDRLVHLYAPLVYMWCARTGLQEADALDVGQEVFQAVWSHIPGFQRQQPGDSFRGWLRIITRNKITDFHRRNRAEKEAREEGRFHEAVTLTEPAPLRELSDPDPDEDGAEASLIYQRAAELIRAEFQEKTWLAFEEVVIKGQTPADTARALQMSTNAVYLAKARVLKRLREEFEDLMDS